MINKAERELFDFLRLTLQTEVIDVLDNAKRMGADTDDLEGSRYIQISDTLAKRFTQILQAVRGGLA